MPSLPRPVLALLLLGLLSTACDEGSLNTFVMAKSDYDQWTQDDQHAPFLNETFESMVVWAPYWDSRLDWYDDVTVYRDAYAIKVDDPNDRRAVEHPEWLLRDAAGDPVYIPFACGNGCPQYAADLGNEAFVADWIATVRDAVDRGYTGLFIDDVNLTWRFGDVDGNDIRPIDPRTGHEMTLTDWRRYMVEFLERVRAEVPEVEIWHNSIWFVDTPTFDDPWVTRQIQAADVINLERGMNDRGLVAGTRRFGMETFMAFIDRVHAEGAQVALLDENATDLEGQWYNIAGALLVNNGGDYVSTQSRDLLSPEGYFEGFDIDLGDALGDRQVVDGTIRREFTEGLVIMNQPRSESVSVDLGREWIDPDGAVVTSVTLDSHEAIVLRRP